MYIPFESVTVIWYPSLVYPVPQIPSSLLVIHNCCIIQSSSFQASLSQADTLLNGAVVKRLPWHRARHHVSCYSSYLSSQLDCWVSCSCINPFFGNVHWIRGEGERSMLFPLRAHYRYDCLSTVTTKTVVLYSLHILISNPLESNLSDNLTALWQWWSRYEACDTHFHIILFDH